MSASKVYLLSLVWCRAHECTHFTNGNNSNFVGKQPSKLCVSYICITQLFLCVKWVMSFAIPRISTFTSLEC